MYGIALLADLNQVITKLEYNQIQLQVNAIITAIKLKM